MGRDECDELRALTARWDAARSEALRERVDALVGRGVPFAAALMIALAAVLEEAGA